MKINMTGSAGGHGKRTRGNPDTAPVPDPTATTRWDHAQLSIAAGQRPRPDFWHPTGPADVTRGWTIAHWLTTHQTDYGVHYVIWQGLIWSTEHPTWEAYRSTIYSCPNPTNLNGCHYNHIHFSTY